MLRPYEPLLNIVPEGWGVIGALSACAVLLSSGGAVVAPALVAAALPAAARFYGDRRLGISCKPRGVLSPVDGRVVHRRECHDPILGREAIRIVIAASWGGGYCLRAPIAGTVTTGAGPLCPRTSRIRGEDGDEIVVRALGSRLLGARPVMMPVGQRLGQGRRCGLRRMTRQIEVIVPAGSRVDVELGQRVTSGESVLATLIRKS